MNAEQYRSLVDRIEKIQENHALTPRSPLQAAELGQQQLSELAGYLEQHGVQDHVIQQAIRGLHQALEDFMLDIEGN